MSHRCCRGRATLIGVAPSPREGDSDPDSEYSLGDYLDVGRRHAAGLAGDGGRIAYEVKSRGGVLGLERLKIRLAIFCQAHLDQVNH